jgi:hypothetical protein
MDGEEVIWKRLEWHTWKNSLATTGKQPHVRPRRKQRNNCDVFCHNSGLNRTGKVQKLSI